MVRVKYAVATSLLGRESYYKKSTEKKSPAQRPGFSTLMKTKLDSFLFDTGFLTFEFAEVKDAGSANNTTFVHINFFNKR